MLRVRVSVRVRVLTSNQKSCALLVRDSLSENKFRKLISKESMQGRKSSQKQIH